VRKLLGIQVSRGRTSCVENNRRPAFFLFSFDESARFDYPAAVDLILKETGQEELYFVGYSMATTQYLVMLSEVPEYNSKIRAGKRGSQKGPGQRRVISCSRNRA
jgi:predicted alpha/beta hydrolase